MRVSRTRILHAVAVVLLTSAASPVVAQDVHVQQDADDATVAKVFKEPGYSPYAGRNFPTQPFWGNQHYHTAISMDAGVLTTLNDEDSYRFALGEEVTTTTGQRVKMSRPLDWLMVSDHAEAYGAMVALRSGDPQLLADPTLKRWYDMIEKGGKDAYAAAWEIIKANGAGTVPAALHSPTITQTAWERHIKTADSYNDPGRFTAIHGYEWTSMPGGDNLHRNVMFRDNADKVSQILPFSALDSDKPEDLWKYLAAYEEKTGGRAMAIPHNPNISGGQYFDTVDSEGNPFSPDYAKDRARWEVLLEVVQTKGQSETAPYLSPNDEFADFGVWDKMNLAATKAHEDSFYKNEYAREALKKGLKLEQQLGTNPFKFGMTGGTDQHMGLTAIEEDNYFGTTPMDEPKANRAAGVFTKLAGSDVSILNGEMLAAGYGAVWAMENTRESLFDAMARKESYATTGTRIVVRFFGGFDFDASDANTRNPAIAGYTKGVPMGGDIGPARDGKVPTFLVAAMKDPIGGNLDRYQIVKGWLDENGETQEKVYDVVWSGDRKPGADGKLPPVGNTVDVATATWTNSIGSPELIAVWKDPDFDPKLKAFYYGRVLEIPTPRWTTYDAKFYGTAIPDGVPPSAQERAYTSPIWYTPG